MKQIFVYISTENPETYRISNSMEILDAIVAMSSAIMSHKEFKLVINRESDALIPLLSSIAKEKQVDEPIINNRHYDKIFPTAMIFIGGNDDTFNDFIYVREHFPECLLFAFGTTGGSAYVISSKYFVEHHKHLSDDLINDLHTSVLYPYLAAEVCKNIKKVYNDSYL